MRNHYFDPEIAGRELRVNMNNLAAEMEWVDPNQILEQTLDTGGKLRLIQSAEQNIYVFFRHQLYAQYQIDDHYSRNLIMVQLFLCHKVVQKQLSKVFGLTAQHISSLVRKYRLEGSVSIEDNIHVRINNNQKIKGKIAKAMIKQLELNETDRPSYGALSKIIKKKYGMSISRQRIGSWWCEQQHKKVEEETAQVAPEQDTLISALDPHPKEKELEVPKAEHHDDPRSIVREGWQSNTLQAVFYCMRCWRKASF